MVLCYEDACRDVIIPKMDIINPWNLEIESHFWSFKFIKVWKYETVLQGSFISSYSDILRWEMKPPGFC